MKKNTILSAAVCALLFILLMIALKVVDVQAIGPENSSVGFAGLNGAVHDLWPESGFWHGITTVTGLFAVLVMILFAAIGAWELYARRSLLKVDREILAMGVLYVCVIVLYVLFDKAVINYRPVLEDGQLESSFPSTHALLAAAVFGSAIVLAQKLVTRKTTQKVIVYACLVLIVLTVFGRLLSGLHWFTDILGGVLAGLALTFAYKAYLEYLTEHKAS